MVNINEKTKAEMILKFNWESNIGKHEELQFCNLNVWRDMEFFPEKVRENLWGKKRGDSFKVQFSKGELFNFSEDNIVELKNTQFIPQKLQRTLMNPRLGRFYPLGFFRGLQGVFPQNFKPTRVIGIDKETIKIDTNLPISKYDLEIEVYILDVRKKFSEVGGECKDWCALSLENGPGMQVRYNGLPTDFEIENPDSFKREDEGEDTNFYKEPRITTHIDSKAHENLLDLYTKILPKKGKVLDLMSSYQSHIPKNEYLKVIGLGLNEEEMRQNIRLSDFFVHDLNKETKLPFGDEEFEVIVCDLSIEYVVNPIELINEVKRILKKGGIFTVSFSNRYFPTKVIKLWIDLHEFERMGYVLELLLRTEGFINFKTFSIRGFMRPYEDKYFGCSFLSDPIYLVYAQKA
ncbi:MAG: methyltransferase domain-containing protein [Thermodesulfovibrio sp.]|nr:methyltransferase domain-containing protein [Thermodesulfovibrio sp.]